LLAAAPSASLDQCPAAARPNHLRQKEAAMSAASRSGALQHDQKLTGLVPVVPTPLNEDESLDENGFERMAAFLGEHRFEGIWALASAGEDQNLSWAVIEEAAKMLVKYIGGQIPILVKTSTPGLKQTLARTRRMADLGFDGAIVHVEQKMLGRDHVRRFYLEAAEASPLPVYVYQNGLRGAACDVDLCLELLEHPNVAGMKAGGSNLGELHPLCQLADESASVMTAGGGQILPGLAMGAAAHTAAPLMMFPQRARAIWDHLQAGRLAEARDEQRRILRFIRRMPKLENREVSGEVKAELEARGVMQRHVSAPFRSASDEEVAQIRDLAEELGIR
jgi:4-hydroxy-tetrahydrodipicolinate synthase